MGLATFIPEHCDAVRGILTGDTNKSWGSEWSHLFKANEAHAYDGMAVMQLGTEWVGRSRATVSASARKFTSIRRRSNPRIRLNCMIYLELRYAPNMISS